MKEIFSKSKNFKQEYCCTIVKLGEVKPIPNYDSIGVTVVDNFTMVVRKDECKEGDILFYAANESELNHDFVSANNLFEIGEFDKNSNAEEVAKLLAEGKNDEAKKLVGFFNKYGRVKMIRLGGTPSFGFLFSQNAMAKWDKSISKINMEDYIGVEFDTVNGIEFCKPYVPRIKEPKVHEHHGPHYKRHKRILKKIERILPGEFAFHYDTQSVERNAFKLDPNDVVDISVKSDGCVERNTIVNTLEYGDKTIGEIVDNKIECKIKTFNIENEEIEYLPIAQFYYVPNDGEWFEIELEDGRKITITGNNPVWLPELNCYRRVDELIGNEVLMVE